MLRDPSHPVYYVGQIARFQDGSDHLSPDLRQWVALKLVSWYGRIVRCRIPQELISRITGLNPPSEDFAWAETLDIRNAFHVGVFDRQKRPTSRPTSFPRREVFGDLRRQVGLQPNVVRCRAGVTFLGVLRRGERLLVKRRQIIRIDELSHGCEASVRDCAKHALDYSLWRVHLTNTFCYFGLTERVSQTAAAFRWASEIRYDSAVQSGPDRFGNGKPSVSCGDARSPSCAEVRLAFNPGQTRTHRRLRTATT